MGIGSPDPPQFIYDDDEYKNVFLSGMLFLSLIIWISSFKSRFLLIIHPLLGLVHLLQKLTL